MAKKSKPKVPKAILGFKLSKGNRKDLKRLFKMFRNPDTHTLAMTAAGGLAAFLAERFAEHEIDRSGGKSKARLAH